MFRGRRASVVTVCCALAVAGVYAWHRKAIRHVEAQVAKGPLTISASQTGSTTTGSWRLRVDRTGKAFLKIDAVPSAKTRQFVVSQSQLDELRQALLRERFFELADSYGQLVPDGSRTTLQISAGDVSQTVELRFFGNWAKNEPEKLQEPSRAVRVLQIIRGWFNDPEAAGMREYDRRALVAAKRVE
jgi:hypothetical protein